MKTTKLIALLGICLISGGFLSCQDNWDDHYGRAKMESEDFTIWNGDIQSYIHSRPELSSMDSLLEVQDMYQKTATESGYTFIVYENAAFAKRIMGMDSILARSCVSDISISPSRLTDGFSIFTRLKKNIWVYQKNDGLHFDDYKLTKRVKTDNGYVYFVDSVIQVRPSVYDLLKSLGSDYSVFKSLVERYEESYFDPMLSTPRGVDLMGNTTYDTVISIRNTLMDRYTSSGLKMWDMRSEDFVSTMFIPSNDLINNAIKSAMDSIPGWLNRAATSADRAKFEMWIVKACFVNKRLPTEDVSTAASDFRCVDGYQQIIDLTQDAKKYEAAEVAWWRPSIQEVDVQNGLTLSNGKAYFLKKFKIPNHVVIYRVKSKFYELWGAMNNDQRAKYFRWTNWISPDILGEAQSPFELSATLPIMFYNVLTAIPSPEAIKDSLVCSVTYDGLLYNSTTKKLVECRLPAGEYYLRMGFKHSLRYSISIYFDNRLLVKDMVLYAQGSNFHFDRGSVSDLDYYGSSTIGFPEGYNWKDWIEKNEKAVAYDTDGYQVAVVNIPRNGNFTITIESNDDSYLYDPTNGRTKNNVTQLMMYHWCLRPTSNNY